MTALTQDRPAVLPVLRRLLAEGRWGLLAWTAGVAAAIALYIPLFPSMQTPELAGLLDSLPPELVRTLGYEDVTSGAGYVQATFFGLIGFVLLTIAGVSWGAAYTGGAEESGRLELTFAHAVSRVPYAIEAWAALLVKLAVLGAVAWLLVRLLDGPAQLDLDPLNLLAGVTAWASLGLVCASAAFAAGAATGRRLWAIGVGAGVAVAGYVFEALANNSDDLEWLRAVSPYAWAYRSTPLADGFDWGGLALLWVVSLGMLGVGAAALSRRDILG